MRLQTSLAILLATFALAISVASANHFSSQRKIPAICNAFAREWLRKARLSVESSSPKTLAVKQCSASSEKYTSVTVTYLFGYTQIIIKNVWGTSRSGFLVEESVGGNQRLTEWSHLWLLRHRNHTAGYGQFSCQLSVFEFTKWWIRHIQVRQEYVDGNQLAEVGPNFGIIPEGRPGDF